MNWTVYRIWVPAIRANGTRLEARVCWDLEKHSEHIITRLASYAGRAMVPAWLLQCGGKQGTSEEGERRGQGESGGRVKRTSEQGEWTGRVNRASVQEE